MHVYVYKCMSWYTGIITTWWWVLGGQNAQKHESYQCERHSVNWCNTTHCGVSRISCCCGCCWSCTCNSCYSWLHFFVAKFLCTTNGTPLESTWWSFKYATILARFSASFQTGKDSFVLCVANNWHTKSVKKFTTSCIFPWRSLTRIRQLVYLLFDGLLNCEPYVPQEFAGRVSYYLLWQGCKEVQD